MTVLNPPGWLQNAGATHTADQLRSYFGGVLLGDKTSLKPMGGVAYTMGGAMAVSEASPLSMNVLVASGICYVAGTESATQGVYASMNDGTVTVPIAAAHATLNRIDLIVVRVRDSQYSGVSNNVAIEAVTGTPGASPSPPATPANSFVLAQVAVNAAVTTINNSNITDRRWYIDDKIILRKAANETVNNVATTQADDDLRLWLAPSTGKWGYRCELFFESSTAADIKVDFTVPSGATFRWGGLGPFGTSDSGDVKYASQATSGGAIAFGGAGATNVLSLLLWGDVVMGATAGLLQLNWSQNAAEVSNTIMHLRSRMEVFRIP